MPGEALRRKATLLAPLAIVAVCALAYANALPNGFVYDDTPQVVENRWLRDPGSLAAIFSSGAWGFDGTVTNYYRPLMHASYLATYQVAGPTPWAFHLVNVLLHAANAILVYFIAASLTRRARSKAAPGVGVLPLAAGVLFACHPIGTEAVTWIGGLPDVSAALFCMASLYLLTRADGEAGAPSWRWILSSAASLFLATLCKEPAMVFVAALAAYDLAFNGRRYGMRAYLARYAPFVAVLAVYLGLRLRALGAFAPVARHTELTATQIALSATDLFAGYLGKLVWPVSLNAWHVFQPPATLTPRTIVGLLVAAGFAAALVATARRRPRAFLALALVAVPLLPALYVPSLGDNPFAERYLYLPSVGFALLAGLTVERFPRAGGVAGAVVAVLFCVATVTRNRVWRDDVTFWTDAARKSPDGPVPHYNLATALEASGRLDEAIEQYRTALRLKPAAAVYRTLANACRARGSIGEAIQADQEAARLAPDDPVTRNELGTFLVEAGRLDEAIEQLAAAVRLQPRAAGPRFNLGVACLQRGRLEEAREQLEAAVRLDPREPRFREMLDLARRQSTTP